MNCCPHNPHGACGHFSMIQKDLLLVAMHLLLVAPEVEEPGTSELPLWNFHWTAKPSSGLCAVMGCSSRVLPKTGARRGLRASLAANLASAATVERGGRGFVRLEGFLSQVSQKFSRCTVFVELNYINIKLN